jgi:hypothetical protein
MNEMGKCVNLNKPGCRRRSGKQELESTAECPWKSSGRRKEEKMREWREMEGKEGGREGKGKGNGRRRGVEGGGN